MGAWWRMSYEYKALIEQAIIDDDRPLDWEEGFKELDEVYAQAAKADEYEAKAKAYEKIRQVFKNNPGVKDKKKLWNIYYESFKVVRELESGETNA